MFEIYEKLFDGVTWAGTAKSKSLFAAPAQKILALQISRKYILKNKYISISIMSRIISHVRVVDKNNGFLIKFLDFNVGFEPSMPIRPNCKTGLEMQENIGT